MRITFLFCLLFSLTLKAQQPSPLSFTMNFSSYTPSITCSHSFVTIALESEYTVSPVSYSWTNGTANFTGSLVNVNSPGTYSITAYANPTLTLVQILTIPVNTVAPAITLSPLSQSITCASNTAMVLASVSNSYSTHYFMSSLGGSFAVQGATAAYYPGMPGTYTHVVVDEYNGCSSQTTFSVFSNDAFPVFSLMSAENFTLGCSSKSMAVVSILQNSATPSGGTVSYTMTTSTNYSTGAASVYSFSSANAGNYTVVVKDDVSLCESKLPLSIIENTFVPYPFVYPNGQIDCKHPYLFSTIIHNEPGNYTYAWGIPFSFTAPVVFNHPYDTLTIFPDTSQGGTFFFAPWALIKNNDTECWTGVSRGIEIDMLPPSVTIKTNRKNLTCKNPSAVLTCSLQSNSPAWNAGLVIPTLWQGPSPQINGTLTSGYLAQTGGIYTVHVMDMQNGCTNVDTIIINDIRSYPTVTSSSQPIELCGSEATLQVVNSYTGPIDFQWHLPGGATANTIVEQLVVNTPGVYTLVAIDPTNECRVSRQFTVVICTGLEDVKHDVLFSVYPNPTQDYIFIEAGIDKTLSVTDALSRVILERKIEHSPYRLDLSSYPAGIYFVNLREKNQVLKCVKVVRKDSE